MTSVEARHPHPGAGCHRPYRAPWQILPPRPLPSEDFTCSDSRASFPCESPHKWCLGSLEQSRDSNGVAESQEDSLGTPDLSLHQLKYLSACCLWSPVNGSSTPSANLTLKNAALSMVNGARHKSRAASPQECYPCLLHPHLGLGEGGERLS